MYGIYQTKKVAILSNTLIADHIIHCLYFICFTFISTSAVSNSYFPSAVGGFQGGFVNQGQRFPQSQAGFPQGQAGFPQGQVFPQQGFGQQGVFPQNQGFPQQGFGQQGFFPQNQGFNQGQRFPPNQGFNQGQRFPTNQGQGFNPNQGN